MRGKVKNKEIGVVERGRGEEKEEERWQKRTAIGREKM